MIQPKLRFNQKNGEQFPEYKQVFLGDLYTERNEKGNSSLPILTISIHSGVSDGEADEDELGKRVNRSEDKSLYKRVYEGDLAFNMMRAWQGAIGVVKSEGMISPAYIAAIPNRKIYPPYMNYLMRTEKMIHMIDRQSYGLTDFRKRLYWNSFAGIKCFIPCLEEQKKVACFFEELDSRIENQKRIIAELRKQRTEIVHKIFAQEIRFKDDAGEYYPEWQDICFDEVFTLLNNNTFSRACLNDKGGIRNIHYGDVLVKFGDVVDLDSAEVPFINSEEKVDRYDKLISGDIVFADTAEDTTVGKATEIFNENAVDVISGLHTIPARPKKRFSKGFLGYYCNSDRFHNQLIPYMQGIKVTSISRSNIVKTRIAVPVNEEQIRIVEFISLLDEQIQNEEVILSELEKMRKGFLQKMFV